jgi:hypothetical protein
VEESGHRAATEVKATTAFDAPDAAGSSGFERVWDQGFATIRYNRIAVARYSASPITAGGE